MSEISRAVLFGKLDTLLFTSLESATAFCKLRGNPYVELVHWLHQLMQQQDGDLQQVIRHFALDEQQLTRDIVAALDALPRGASSVSDLSEHIDSAVERAWVYGSLKFGSTPFAPAAKRASRPPPLRTRLPGQYRLRRARWRSMVRI